MELQTLWTSSVTSVSPLLPLQAVLKTLLQPVSTAIQKVQTFREANRSSPLFNHLSAVSESVPALGWVAMVRFLGLYVTECWGEGVGGGLLLWKQASL